MTSNTDGFSVAGGMWTTTRVFVVFFFENLKRGRWKCKTWKWRTKVIGKYSTWKWRTWIFQSLQIRPQRLSRRGIGTQVVPRMCGNWREGTAGDSWQRDGLASDAFECSEVYRHIFNTTYFTGSRWRHSSSILSLWEEEEEDSAEI